MKWNITNNLFALLITLAVCNATELNAKGLRLLENENCGLSTQAPQVGYVASGSRPWMAIIKTKEGLSCYGTLITDQFVLTAAHCVEAKYADSIALGKNIAPVEWTEKSDKTKCLPPPELFGVEKTYIHENYERNRNNFANDIALIKLNRTVDFKENIKPICLPATTELQAKLGDLQDLHLTAWFQVENALRENSVQRISHANCTEIVKFEININEICILQDIESCRGISGSPLSQRFDYLGAQRFVQFGIAHFGRGCSPLLAINVAAYMPWIANVLGTN